MSDGTSFLIINGQLNWSSRNQMAVQLLPKMVKKFDSVREH